MPEQHTTCPKCGKTWIKWHGSKLESHARCYYTDAEGDALLARFRADERLTVEMFARELGVPRSVVQSALYHAQRRARRPAIVAD